jgi:FtsX-like permease family
MGAVAARARALLRTNVRATLVLAVLAGFAGGFVLAAWSAARRGTTSFDRFLTATAPPDLMIGLCAPDATAHQLQTNTCPPYDPVTETARIRKFPSVEAAGRGALVFGFYELGGQIQHGPISVVVGDGDFPTLDGTPVVVEGRRADPTRADEIVIPEEAARLYDVEVGDVIDFTPDRADRSRGRDTAHLNVVGRVRTAADLAAGVDPTASALSVSIPYAGPAFWDRYGRGALTTGTIFAFVRTSGHSSGKVDPALRRAYGDRAQSATARHADEERNVDDAIRYETTALLVVALAAAAAWVVFVGQALVRQSTREQSDANTLIALGMTRAQLISSAALRAVPVAALATLIAVLTSVGSSSVTPIGRAGRAEVHAGIDVDVLVAAVGAVALFAATVASVAAAGATIGARSRRRSARIASHSGRRLLMPIVALAGTSFLGSSRRRGLAIRTGATTAIAIAVAATGLGLLASLRHLNAHPRNYGTSWDALLINAGDDTEFDADTYPKALSAVRDDPDVLDAGAFQYNGDAAIHGKNVIIVGTWTVKGPPRPWMVITGGRAPHNEREIALGPKTARDLGLHIGDRTDVHLSGANGATTDYVVVGVALFYDGMRVGPGEGGFVDLGQLGDARTRIASVLSVRASVSRPEWHTIRSANIVVVPAPPPPGVRNLNLVNDVPSVIAAIVGLLAVAALAHAIVTLAHAHQRSLAVLRALGCTRQQIEEALASAAIAIVAIGIVVGVPIGLVAQHVIWSTLEANIGFSSPWFTSVIPIVVVGGALPIAATVGATQGRAASKRSATESLGIE